MEEKKEGLMKNLIENDPNPKNLHRSKFFYRKYLVLISKISIHTFATVNKEPNINISFTDIIYQNKIVILLAKLTLHMNRLKINNAYK